MVDSVSHENAPVPPPRRPSSALFANNRKPCAEHKLSKIGYEVPRMPNGSLDLSKGFEMGLFDEDPFCLIGYPIRRFLSTFFIQGLTATWGVPVEFQPHPSGWIVFQFCNEQDLLGVLQLGHFFVLRSPLILRRMPTFFDFSTANISIVPVWVKFDWIPLQMMKKECIEVLASQIGNPVMTDKVTFNKTRWAYARALIEIDVAKELVTELHITLPGGKSYVQFVEYEHVSFFCGHCSMLGHSERNCKRNASGGGTVQPIDKQVWRKVERGEKVGEAATPQGEKDAVLRDGSMRLGDSMALHSDAELLINKRQGKWCKSPGKPVELQTRNSFDLLDELGDADGISLGRMKGVPGMGD
ncbi:hypothetical protein Dimus_037901 [Dionaea muscipula]